MKQSRKISYGVINPHILAEHNRQVLRPVPAVLPPEIPQGRRHRRGELMSKILDTLDTLGSATACEVTESLDADITTTYNIVSATLFRCLKRGWVSASVGDRLVTVFSRIH